MEPGKVDKVKGEAKFIRATVLFDLVRLYAKSWNDGDPASNDGVSIVFTPTLSITADNQVTKSKVADVYAQILIDLTDAEAKLPVKNGFFASKVTAAFLAARVYLQKVDYANAANAANRVISMAPAGGFSLKTAYADAFPNNVSANTTEDIFAMQVTPSS